MRFSSVSLGLGCLVLSSAALAGCDTSTLPDGAVGFVTAPDDDPWSGPPAVDHVQVDFVQGTTRSSLADLKAPPSTVSIGNGGPSDVVAHFEATGLTSAGDAVVFGSSIPFTVKGFAGAYVPLFVARKGGFATAPSSLLSPHIRPLSVLASQAYQLVVGSGDAAIDFFDSGTWAAPSDAPPLPQTVKSMAISGWSLLMINDTQANWLDLTSSSITPASPLPAGLRSFGDIAGGQTLVASDGTIYIVGATRTEGDPTNSIVQIDPAGVLHTLLLKTARLGAAATLVEDSLLVAGGSADGAGAELLPVSANSFNELDLPADDTTGASLVELTSASALLAGGHDASGAPAPTRGIDLGCSSKCRATKLPKASLSIAHASAFRLAENVALIVGETDDEETHAYLFDASGDEAMLTEQALRTPRSQASATRLPNGQVAIVGGTELSTLSPALSVDIFFP
ncbi:MAG: hypothetical protein ABIQ16_17565 [Polyangiaceae bacterium]